MSDISLSAGIRANLLSLQNTSSLLFRTQERLGTGRKVNSAIDNPASFFTSEALKTRANDLTNRLDGISKAIQTTKAADAGIKGIRTLISQLKGIAQDAQGTSDTSERQTLYNRYSEVLRQVSELSEDSGYDGVNLLRGGNITVQFNETSGQATLAVSGFIGDSTGLSFATFASSVAENLSNWTAAVTALEAAETELRKQSRTLSSNLSILTTREDFTRNLVNTLQTGADKLTLADTNEEAAKLLALNTQQQLGVNSVSLASQSAQSVLRLLG